MGAIAKPRKYGHPIGRYTDGRCKECARQLGRRNHATNPEPKKAYRRANRQRVNETDRTRYAANQAELERVKKFQRDNPKKILVYGARTRARRGGYVCTITETDFEIPELCPLLGVKLKRGTGPYAPTLDNMLIRLTHTNAEGY